MALLPTTAPSQFLKPGADQRGFAKTDAGRHEDEWFVEAAIQFSPSGAATRLSTRRTRSLQLGMQKGKCGFFQFALQ